jgi:hypothetical protein
MKISDILQNPSSLPLSKKKGSTEGKEIDFQQLLKEAGSRQLQNHPTASSSSTAREVEDLSIPVLSLPPLNGVLETQEMNQLRSQGVKGAEKILEVLEEYQKAIADPRRNLREIGSLVQSLSREAESLKKLAEKVPWSDPLQKIMTDLGIVSTVEIEKFNRGEYI